MPTLEETIVTFLGDLSYSKTSEHDIPFTEEDGTKGNVTMAYLYAMPFRSNPEKKQLIIKRIEVLGKGIVTPTLQKVLQNTPLTEIKIESIQNEGWVPKLQEKGWSIEEDMDGLTHALIRKGGRKIKPYRMKTRKQRIPFTIVFLRILDIIKLFHWNTKVYSKHVATDELYKSLSKLTDSYVEKSFGENGRIPVHTTVSYHTLSDKEFEREVTAFKEYLIKLHNPSTDLSNIRDEMLGEVNQFLYLWSFNEYK